LLLLVLGLLEVLILQATVLLLKAVVLLVCQPDLLLPGLLPPPHPSRLCATQFLPPLLLQCCLQPSARRTSWQGSVSRQI
jgi:hypothetical protein